MTVPGLGPIERLVAPVTDHVSVLDCPAITFAGVAVKVAMVGLLDGVVAPINGTPAKRAQITMVMAIPVLIGRSKNFCNVFF